MNTSNEANPPAEAPLAAEAQKAPAYGSLLGIILIVAVLVIGAFYVWNERLDMNQPVVPEDGVRGGDSMPSEDVVDDSVEGSVEFDAEVPMPQ